MKTLLINTYDYGGAAKACIRLHHGLLKKNIDSRLLLKLKTSNTSQSFQFTINPKPQTKIIKLKNKFYRIAQEIKLVPPPTDPFLYQKQFLVQRDTRLEYFSFPISDCNINQSSLYEEADIIHLHWVADFLDWESFFSKNTKPIVWTLHDQNPFLGGEHYKERFLGLDGKGYPIPRKYTPLEIQKSKEILGIKKRTLQNVDNLHIVSPSRWLLESSQSSELFAKYPHYHIQYGYPTDIFKPYNRPFCREVLGIPHDKIVLLFVADSVDSNRKGFVYLQKAIENLSAKYEKEVILCAIGNKAEMINKNNLLELGKVVDERLMAMAYSASDVFVIPSLEDNLPNTMIEAILCGTPTIGFPTGGIIDAIQDGVNGYLCPEISVNALKETLEKFLENPTHFASEKIAQDAKEKYALEVQAKKYISLYESILAKS